MSANEYVTINGVRYAAIALAGGTDSNGNDAGRVVAEISASVYGNYPETWYDASTAQAGDALANTAFGAMDVTSYEGVIFMETAGDVTVQISIDGTNYEAVDVYFRDLGAVDGTAEEHVLVNTTNGATGPFLMLTPCSKMQFLNHGAVQSTVRFARVGKVNI